MFKAKNIINFSTKYIKKYLTLHSQKTNPVLDIDATSEVTYQDALSINRETHRVEIRKAIYNRFADEINAGNKQSQDNMIQFVATKQERSGATSKETNWTEIRKLIYQRFADEIVSGNKHIQDDVIKYSPAKSVNKELEAIKEQGYSFAKQKMALKRSITDKWDEIERIKYLSQDIGWDVKNQQKSLSQDDSIVGRMKSLSIKGYWSNYAGDDELSQSINSVIKIKDTMIAEFMHKVYDKHINTTESQPSIAETTTFDSLQNEQEVMVLGE